MAPQRLSLPPAVAANPLARPVPRPQQKRKKKQDGIRGPGGVRYGLAHHLDEPSELTEANPVRRRRKAIVKKRIDAHKPVFTDLMKAAAVGRQSEVEYLLTQPETLLTLFATDRSGRNALEWARQKKFDGCASLIQEAMSREVRVRAEDREAQERIFDLKRIVRTNGRIRAVVEHAINERDIVTISNCVDGADFDRQEYVRACNLLQGYMNRHSDETVITDNSQEEFDPDPEAYYVDVETLAGDGSVLKTSIERATRRWRRGGAAERSPRPHKYLTKPQRRHGPLRGLRREPG